LPDFKVGLILKLLPSNAGFQLADLFMNLSAVCGYSLSSYKLPVSLKGRMPLGKLVSAETESGHQKAA
jgi:hypothetical protein